jgi:dipeptidase E
MKLYLSSYRVGDHADKLKELINKDGARVAVCVNALDGADLEVRNSIVLARELADITELGYLAEELDLRNYFNNDDLDDALKQYDAVWLSGGNTFILAKAFKQSGFDKLFHTRFKSGDLVYAGYSAAFCVLSDDLHGVELVDDKDAEAEGYEPGEIWKGLGIIDFYPIVHFRSNHHESDDVEKEYNYVVENNIPHKTFKDGDVYLVNGDDTKVLS